MFLELNVFSYAPLRDVISVEGHMTRPHPYLICLHSPPRRSLFSFRSCSTSVVSFVTSTQDWANSCERTIQRYACIWAPDMKNQAVNFISTSKEKLKWDSKSQPSAFRANALPTEIPNQLSSRSRFKSKVITMSTQETLTKFKVWSTSTPS